MDYQNARKLEIRDTHARRIEAFARRYKKNRPTIVLIPGGMGSQIDRSAKPFRGNASLPFKKFDPIWMDLGIIFDREALQLEIKDNGHDLDNHICIPNGPVRFIIEPYNATADFFRAKDYNYIVFAYDWRRSVVESAGFLKFFLQLLKNRVQDLRQEDPLPHTTLLCHSMGGLVTKVFLHRVFKQSATAADVQQWMDRFVTVATPFYGAATHMTRYYKGQEPLNIITGIQPLARVIGTLPGPYTLMFLDRNTYARNADQLEIDRYPVRDSSHTDQKADPFDEDLFERLCVHPVVELGLFDLELGLQDFEEVFGGVGDDHGHGHLGAHPGRASAGPRFSPVRAARPRRLGSTVSRPLAARRAPMGVSAGALQYSIHRRASSAVPSPAFTQTIGSAPVSSHRRSHSSVPTWLHSMLPNHAGFGRTGRSSAEPTPSSQ